MHGFKNDSQEKNYDTAGDAYVCNVEYREINEGDRDEVGHKSLSETVDGVPDSTGDDKRDADRLEDRYVLAIPNEIRDEQADHDEREDGAAQGFHEVRATTLLVELRLEGTAARQRGVSLRLLLGLSQQGVQGGNHLLKVVSERLSMFPVMRFGIIRA